MMLVSAFAAIVFILNLTRRKRDLWLLITRGGSPAVWRRRLYWGWFVQEAAPVNGGVMPREPDH